ncbi:MAG: hypothetical protein H8E32_05105 [Nitrospinae bacterium]|nr:hypothetical protein [Nitrospinota bacterium]
MNKKILAFFVSFLILTGGASYCFADAGHKPYSGSKAFERMKRLAGNWEGSANFGQGIQTIKAHYKLTSSDSAVIETFHVGTPHEMVSVYHDNKSKKLMMTHYCAEHNQPKLVLKEWGNNKLSMDLSADNEIDVGKESHIHAAAIEFEGEDRMTHKWTSFKDGKQDQVVKIVFKRVD